MAPKGKLWGGVERAGEECVKRLLPTAPSPTASAGGNAGIAAAYAARKLGIPATIVLPEGTSVNVVKRLQGEGAEVQLTGKVRTPRRARQLEGLLPPRP